MFVICFSSAQKKRDGLVRIEQARLGTGSTLAKEREKKLCLKTKSIHELRVVGRGSPTLPVVQLNGKIIPDMPEAMAFHT